MHVRRSADSEANELITDTFDSKTLSKNRTSIDVKMVSYISKSLFIVGCYVIGFTAQMQLKNERWMCCGSQFASVKQKI